MTAEPGGTATRRADRAKASGPRVALVTGGSKGIGAATCRALASQGAAVAVGYATDEDGANATAAAIAAESGTARTVAIDVADVASVDAACKAVEAELGPITIAVNNGAITRDGLVMRMADDQWDDVVRTNLTGAFHVIRRCTPAMMKARFGRIVNVSSASASLGAPGQANYAAAKAGLLGLTRSVARELASRGITANVVAPGPIATAMTDAMPAEWHDALERQVPIGRFGTPEEVAAMITFLCSEAAGYVTGALIPVDGGLAMGH